MGVEVFPLLVYFWKFGFVVLKKMKEASKEEVHFKEKEMIDEKRFDGKSKIDDEDDVLDLVLAHPMSIKDI